MIRIIALLLCLGTSATAQVLPAVYAVTDVAANDVLNIRTHPSIDAEIIGFLAHNAPQVEVISVSSDNKWAKVGASERSGWASMRYLRLTSTDTDLPLPMICFGTEPFWGLSMTQTNTEFTRMGEPSISLSRIASKTMNSAYFVEFGENIAVDRIAVITRQSCNDGMSDREFGFRIDLYSNKTVGGSQFSGCCTLQTDN